MIQLLDQQTINQIAAGEVVERPASVVKEVVENAIDAKANAITVEIKEGGISYIRVTDNGVGIPKEEIEIAFQRHTTSKIRSVEDIHAIGSLGFRGEALASIAAVSHMEVITKTLRSITGVRILLEGGAVVNKQEIGCPVGTTLMIKNLFYNTPARRKFLKKPSTEFGHISEIIQKIALSHPDIAFKFIHNNNVILHTSGNNQLKHTVFQVFDKQAVKNMIYLEEEKQGIQVRGFIGKPQYNRSNRSQENFFVNGRYIKSKVLQNALEEAYQTKLPLHKYPVCVLQVQIDFNAIDVNVHPTKMEVRFEQEEEVFETVHQMIRGRLEEESLIYQFEQVEKKKKMERIKKEEVPEPFEISNDKIDSKQEKLKKESKDIKTIQPIRDLENRKEEEFVKEKDISYPNRNLSPADEFKDQEVPPPSVYTNETISPNRPETIQGVQEEIQTKEELLFQVVGQLFNTYWIVQKEKEFFFVDQHAAHERVLYEKIRLDIKENTIHSQPLLQPEVITMGAKELEKIEQYDEMLGEFGFEFEAFGSDSVIIRSVPLLFGHPMTHILFLDMVDLLEDYSAGSISQQILFDKMAVRACKAAVKAKDKISPQELVGLLQQLFQYENPFTCPHGRPTMIRMTQYELEKKFKRI